MIEREAPIAVCINKNANFCLSSCSYTHSPTIITNTTATSLEVVIISTIIIKLFNLHPRSTLLLKHIRAPFLQQPLLCTNDYPPPILIYRNFLPKSVVLYCITRQHFYNFVSVAPTIIIISTCRPLVQPYSACKLQRRNKINTMTLCTTNNNRLPIAANTDTFSEPYVCCCFCGGIHTEGGT